MILLLLALFVPVDCISGFPFKKMKPENAMSG
jgi:hypothetical protein